MSDAASGDPSVQVLSAEEGVVLGRSWEQAATGGDTELGQTAGGRHHVGTAGRD